MILETVLAVALAFTPILPGAPRVLQTTNPIGVEFTASPDHAAVQGTTPIVASYRIDITAPTGGPVIASRDFGKPTPVGTVITYTQLGPFFNALSPGTYVAQVCAVGPGGAGCSATASLPFPVIIRSPAAPSGVIVK